jgi:lipopolysaccharide transport system ATP-binding protein
LFVSHSPSAVKTLCNRAILLDRGTVLRDDTPDAVLDYYNAVVARREAENAIRVTEAETGVKITRSGTQEATITAIELLDAAGRPSRALRSCEPASITLEISVLKTLPELTVGILIRDVLGNNVFGTNSFHHGKTIMNPEAGSKYHMSFNFSPLALGRGNYSISVALHTYDTHIVNNYDWWDRAIVFQIISSSRPLSIGVCDLPIQIQLKNKFSKPTQIQPFIAHE